MIYYANFGKIYLKVRKTNISKFININVDVGFDYISCYDDLVVKFFDSFKGSQSKDRNGDDCNYEFGKLYVRLGNSVSDFLEIPSNLILNDFDELYEFWMNMFIQNYDNLEYLPLHYDGLFEVIIYKNCDNQNVYYDYYKFSTSFMVKSRQSCENVFNQKLDSVLEVLGG